MIGCSKSAFKVVAIAVLPILLVLAAISGANGQEPTHALLGKPAPFFSIRSGDDETLVPDMFRGKVAVIFYETRGASRKNSDIKNRFNKLYDGQDEAVRRSIVRIPVINCSRVVWPLRAVWKQGLKYHSKRVGITLYGDWDGRMATDYRMKDGDSNLIIVDGRGIIRYVSAGHITDKQFHEIEELLDTLVNLEK
jgi:hypothetical protein